MDSYGLSLLRVQSLLFLSIIKQIHLIFLALILFYSFTPAPMRSFLNGTHARNFSVYSDFLSEFDFLAHLLRQPDLGSMLHYQPGVSTLAVL